VGFFVPVPVVGSSAQGSLIATMSGPPMCDTSLLAGHPVRVRVGHRGPWEDRSPDHHSWARRLSQSGQERVVYCCEPFHIRSARGICKSHRP